MKKLLLILMILAIPSFAQAATIYVRTDGGTGTQCTGTTDAAYPGSGTGQACAYNHPNWPLPMNGQPTTYKASAGDTIVIHGPDDGAGTGQYRMGCSGSANCTDSTINITNTATCHNTYTYDCGNVAPPSGSSGNPTVIIGCSTSGCGSSALPQLWGAGRQTNMFNLTGLSYIDFIDIEITDHEASGLADCSATISSLCSRNGFYGNGGWHHLNFNNVNVHGLANRGFLLGGQVGGTDHDSTFTDVQIVRNAQAGFDGDTCSNNNTCPFHGDMVFTRPIIKQNGCVENYPITGTGLVDGECRDSNNGGYGDGLSTARTSGNWYFYDAICVENTSDCLDLLYGSDTTPANVYIDGGVYAGNVGNQIKFRGANFELTNALVIGNCSYFDGKAFTDSALVDCRGGNTTIAIEGDGVSGAVWNIFNNTIVTELYAIYVSDNYSSSCDGSEILNVKNNIFIDLNTEASTVYADIGSCSLSAFNKDYNVVDNDFTTTPCPSGNNQCTDPLVTSDPVASQDYETNLAGLYLTASSPAIGADSADETVTMWYSSNDYNNYVRGAIWDTGALEYGSVASSSVVGIVITGDVTMTGNVVFTF